MNPRVEYMSGCGLSMTTGWRNDRGIERGCHQPVICRDNSCIRWAIAGAVTQATPGRPERRSEPSEYYAFPPVSH